jgi:Tfp pilus assembly protein PilF
MADINALSRMQPDATRAMPPLVRLVFGHDMLQRGHAEPALATADEVLRGAPHLVDAMVLRGAACKALGRFGEAVAAFEQALAYEPGRAAVLVTLANSHAERHDLAEAERCLKRALALEPRMGAAHASLISVYGMTNRVDLLEAACRAALAIDAGCFNAHQHLAELYAKRGEAEAAQRHRDAAYRTHNLFSEPAARPAPTALVLLSAADGNVPLRYLISRDRYAVVKWLVEYGEPGQEARLPPYDFVFNAIGEPELPAATHAAATRFARVCHAPFLNRPDRVMATGRPDLPALLAGLPDVVVPQVARWRAGDAPPGAWLDAGPVLVRPLGSHGGSGLVRAANEAEFAQATAPHPACDVTMFHDFASPDGLFRKYRMVFVDRRPLPYHLAVGDRWLVHYFSSDMLGDAARRAEEQKFLADPEAVLGKRAVAALTAIARRLDLDYGGIDFSLLPSEDGAQRVLVFEANATMVVHPEAEGGLLAYKNAAVRAILDAFDAMVAARCADAGGRDH